VQADLETEGYEVQPFLLPAYGVNAPHERYRIFFVAYSGHAESSRSKQPKTDNHRCCSEGVQERNKPTPRISNGPTPDTESRERKNRWKNVRMGWVKELDTEYRWQQFPIEGAVCYGNDGLSERLDGITFPKWRNESIKAGGNAIVPQVALQIFKAIQQYETS